MTQITIDASLSTQLQQLGRVAELRDPSGRVVGRFVPLVPWSNWEPVTPEPTEAELDYAHRVVAAFDEARAAGQGSIALGGQLIDLPIVERDVALSQ